MEPARLGTSGKKNFLLYGIPSIGKTRFIGSGRDVLIVRPPTDHTTSILSPNSRNVKEIVSPDWSAMNDVFTYLHDEGDSWDWVWLDSISLWQDQGLRDIFKDAVRRNPKRADYGIDKGEYGINMQRISAWIQDVVGLSKFNFGVTAHPFWAEDPLSEEEVMMPFIQGRNMPEKICGMMNLVGFMHWKKFKSGEDTVKKRVIEFNSTGEFYAKDQFGKLEKPLVNPTFDDFLAAFGAAKPKAKTTTTKAKRPVRKARRTK